MSKQTKINLLIVIVFLVIGGWYTSVAKDDYRIDTIELPLNTEQQSQPGQTTSLRADEEFFPIAEIESVKPGWRAYESDALKIKFALPDDWDIQESYLGSLLIRKKDPLQNNSFTIDIIREERVTNPLLVPVFLKELGPSTATIHIDGQVAHVKNPISTGICRYGRLISVPSKKIWISTEEGRGCVSDGILEGHRPDISMEPELMNDIISSISFIK